MKIAQIRNLKRPVLLCELPEGATDASFRFGKYLTYRKQHSYVVEQFTGDWEPLGWLTELKEDQFAELAPPSALFNGFFRMATGGETEGPELAFESYVRAAGWYWENPYGRTEPEDVSDLGFFTQMLREKHKKWKVAQERVLDRWRCFVIVNKEANGKV